MRRAAKVDANQHEIVDALRGVGASVSITSAVGEGFPDIAVGYKGQNLLLEIKDGSKPPSDRKLTPAQQKWHREWCGTVLVVETVKDAFRAIGLSVTDGDSEASEYKLKTVARPRYHKRSR